MTPELTAQINAAYDFLWAQRNQVLAQVPWPFHDQVAAQTGPAAVLAEAGKLVTQINAAAARAQTPPTPAPVAKP
jgi:hypothetical protein